MKPQRVLYLSPNSKKAGAEQLTLAIAKNHSPAWSPEFYFFEPGPFADEVKSAGIPVHLSQIAGRPRLRHPWSVLKRAQEIRALIKSRGIHLVHSVMGYGHIFGGLASKRSGAAEVWFQHGPTGRLDWLSGVISSQAVLVNSLFTLEEEKRYHPRVRFMKLVYPGFGPVVTDEKLRSQAKELRSKFADPDDVVYSMIGRITEAKGHVQLLQAFDRIRSKTPRMKLWLVGEPFLARDYAFQKDLLELSKTLGMERQVIHTGFFENPQTVLLASDVVVNATKAPEPFGLSLLEAMHFSKPVIAPNQGGPAELVQDGSTGLLFEPNSSGELAERMLKLYESKERRLEMGRKAGELAVSRFSTARMIGELEDAYREVLDL